MRRLLVVAAAVGLCVGILSGAPIGADATGTLTVYGPTTAALNSTVTFGGHTPQPGQTVYLHYRLVDNASSSGYSYTGPARSGPRGAYQVQLPLPLSADYSYYVTSNGARTQLHQVRVRRAECTSSGAAFPHQPPDNEEFHYETMSAFTATRGSTWAGVGVDHNVFTAIRWSARTGLTVLGHFTYENYDPGSGGSVDAVGITPYGSVVASVEDQIRQGQTRIGYVWTPDNVRHRLRAPATWDVVRPIGVADDGRIFGVTEDLGQGAADTTRLVSWAGAYSTPVVLTTLRGAGTEAFVDQAGDVIYSLRDGTAHVRLASGAVRSLRTPVGYSVYPQRAAGHRIYAEDAGGGVVQWDLRSVPPTGPLTSTTVASAGAFVHGAGRDGDVVLDNGGSSQSFVRYHLITSLSRYADVPPRVQNDNVLAVDYRGVTAYTSATDHLPHFLRCA